MAEKALNISSTRQVLRAIHPRAGVLMATSGVILACASLATLSSVQLFLIFTGAVLMLFSGSSLLLGWKDRRNRYRITNSVAEFVGLDVSACFVSDEDGEIHYMNAAAQARFDKNDRTSADLLRHVLANPGAILFRVQTRAASKGAAREDIVTRQGHMRLSAHRLIHGGFLWRVEDIASAASRGGETSTLPTLTVGRNGTVLFMNASARNLVGERAKSLERVFETLPVQAGHRNRIMTPDGMTSCLVAEIPMQAGRRELVLLPQNDTADTHNEGNHYFDELPVPLLKLAVDGKVILSNRMARDLLGRSDCDGAMVYDLMEGLGRSISDWLTEVAEERNSKFSEFLRVTREDREVFVQVMLKRVVEEGRPVLVAVLNDATELKSLEAQFVQSQKMQAIGQLAGGVAHDFNNLLTAISGHCDLLLLRHDQGDPDYGDLVQINQNANRAAALVGQLLAFSRKQTLRPESLDLRNTLSDLTHLLNRLVGEKITLTLSHDPLLKAIRADKRQLEQVVMNLVVNARDAMPSGGEITITTENLVLQEQMERDRAVVPSGTYVAVKVQDQGCGIPADKMQKIFEPFFTTKRTGEGTGLGLSTAYGIVKQTGGFIFADSTPGQGTCFTLLFPAGEAKTTRVEIREETSTHKPAKHGEGVVLLVEDEAPVRAFASRALRLRGYTVLEAVSAEDALKVLDETEMTIDLFVTDVVMPGMDGPSWVKIALESRPGIGVVFVSGYAEDAFGEGQPKIPNSVFLPKPFSLAELTKTVQKQLH